MESSTPKDSSKRSRTRSKMPVSKKRRIIKVRNCYSCGTKSSHLRRHAEYKRLCLECYQQLIDYEVEMQVQSQRECVYDEL